MLSFLLLSIVLTLINACQPCYYGGNPISCGGVFNGKMCCNGVWCNGCCSRWCCPSNNYTQDAPHYKLSKSGIPYSKYVTKAIFNEVTQSFYNDTVHSTKLMVGDYVLWPTSFKIIDKKVIPSDQMKMMRLISHSVNATHHRCCNMIYVYGNPPCAESMCCGIACCCFV